MRTANPALNENVFKKFFAAAGSPVMTVQGTVNKTGVLLFLCAGCAVLTWIPMHSGDFLTAGILALGGLLGGLVFGLTTAFKPAWAPVTAPLYAACEGLFLGAISSIYDLHYPGRPIVLHAVLLTFGTLFALLAAYTTRLIRATENFKLGVFAATGGIALVYLVSFVLSLFGIRLPFIHESGLMGIGFSLFVVTIAALNLVLDFDFIETGADSNAPKFMEWYGAYGLLVTLVWLYLEILRLLSKLASRRD
ncbi:MAG: Bax inhibitor-1/YccA family protein [Planctomycetes bacterium]|nr:Bax inhibitor-1/YccA family protein [Planctomycetota bacterium]